MYQTYMSNAATLFKLNDQSSSALRSYILFHPDFNRRLWNFTKSADTLIIKAARGLSPPVGNFTPP